MRIGAALRVEAYQRERRCGLFRAAVLVVGVAMAAPAQAQSPAYVPPATEPYYGYHPVPQVPAPPTTTQYYGYPPPAQEAVPQAQEPAAPVVTEETPNDDVPERKTDRAVFIITDKRTATHERVTLKAGQPLSYGKLELTLTNCWIEGASAYPQQAALVTITEPDVSTTQPRFHGWLFAHSTQLTALEHPHYDVTLAWCEQQPAQQKQQNKN